MIEEFSARDLPLMRLRIELEAKIDEVEATVCSIAAAGVQIDKITTKICTPIYPSRSITDYPITIGFKK